MYTPIENETSPEQQSSLPDAWIGRIFDHMSALYGSKLADLWNGSNPDSVKRVWAEKLGGFRSMPNAIKEALNALDSKPFPPTLPEFLTMCREAGRRQAGNTKAIAYTPTPEELAKANSMIQAAAESMTKPSRDYLDWAWKLKDRHEKGDRLSALQVSSYKSALGGQA